MSPEAHPTEDESVPNAMRVPPDDEFHKFQPTAVAMAVAVYDARDLIVADICGEFAAAKLAEARPFEALENGPSKADCEVGDCVASDSQRDVGCATAAAPVIQSQIAFAKNGSSATF